MAASVPGLALQCQHMGASHPRRRQQVSRSGGLGDPAAEPACPSHMAPTRVGTGPHPRPGQLPGKSENAGAALRSWVQEGRPDDISPDICRRGRRCCAQNAPGAIADQLTPARRSPTLISVIACPLSQVRFRTILVRKNSFSKPGRCLLRTSARRSSGRLHSANADLAPSSCRSLQLGSMPRAIAQMDIGSTQKCLCYRPFLRSKKPNSKCLCARDLVSSPLLLQATVHSPRLIYASAASRLARLILMGM